MGKSKQFIVSFEENGGEYYGQLNIKCRKLKKNNDYSFSADDVEIIIDERIYKVEEIHGQE